jgi:hypothetical protein
MLLQCRRAAKVIVREEETGQYETEKEDKQQYEKRKRRERTKEGRRMTDKK